MERSDFYIDFCLFGTLTTPKEISRRTGITPDDEMLEGQRNRKLNLPRKNIWSIISRSRSDEVSDHWSELAARLQGAEAELIEIAKTGTPKITIVINTDSKRLPPLGIPPAMSRFAGAIGAEIDIDDMQ